MVNRGTNREAFVDRATSSSDETIGRLWERYEKLKTASAVVDFDDMLVRALQAVREDAKVRDAVGPGARGSSWSTSSRTPTACRWIC